MMWNISLWDFAVSFYQEPDVKEQCLLLQDACDADIPLVIFALWLSTQAVRLEPADWQQVFIDLDLWRSDVIKPLRHIRKKLKKGPPPAPCTATNELREMIKLAELNAEKIELTYLESQAVNKKIAQPFDPHALAKFNLEQILICFSYDQNPTLIKDAAYIFLERLRAYS